MIETLNTTGGPTLTDKGAEAFLGPPDLTTNAKALHEMVRTKYARKRGAYTPEQFADMNLFRVYVGYCSSIGRRGKADLTLGELYSQSWQDDTEFCTASIWVYEEAKHFEQDMYPHIGYHAYFFFVRDGRIVAASHVMGWQDVSPTSPGK